MPPTRSRDTLTPMELTRLLHRLEDVVGEAGRLREQITRRLAGGAGRQAPRFIAARRAPVRRRR